MSIRKNRARMRCAEWKRQGFSDRFDEAWTLVATTYQRKVHVLASVIDITPKPEKKRQAKASG